MKRRHFVTLSAAALVVNHVQPETPASASPQPGSDGRDAKQPTPQQALSDLAEGNRRYASGKLLEFQLNEGRLQEQQQGQSPFATIIGCSDSRVPIELIFDQDPGDLFVIRLAGNVIDPDVVGSLEYAAVHLKTPLIVVMGHEGCGAVTAALAAKSQQEKELFGVRQLLAKILPAIRNIDQTLPLEKQVELGVEANVRWGMKRIREHPDHRKAIQNGNVVVAGAVYELASGRVRFLND
ncbi:MAG: carbonic anhydrase [Rubripirellula sp.]